MESYPREIESYRTRTGKAPFREWLDGLQDVQARAKIRVRLDRLRLGNLGDCKLLGSGLFELRVHFGPGYRIYFGQKGKRIVVLLAGGVKDTQQADILKAFGYWKDYRSRKDDGT